jgi:parallel beta-helix repeat protein
MKLLVLFVVVMSISLSALPRLTVDADNRVSVSRLEYPKLSSASSNVLTVPDDFAKIQDAINSADPGDTVFVREGTYNETITLNKSISLVGENRANTVIDAQEKADVIFVSAGNCLISRFTLKNGGMPLPANCGVNISNSDGNVIDNNTIIGNFVGVNLGDQYRGSRLNVIRYNDITQDHYGVFLAHANNNEIYGNTIHGNEWNGVELDWCEGNAVQGNTISDNGAYGFEIPLETPGRDNLIYHNNFLNNSYGVSASTYRNIWDDGYPSGGNYWDDYIGKDSSSGFFQNITGSDGIGDDSYSLDENNRDRFPLAGVYHSVNTHSGYRIDVVSNSTVETLCWLESNKTLKIRVSNGTLEQTGFCRIRIPHSLIEPNDVSVLIDEGQTPILYQNLALHDDGTYRWTMIVYPSSAHEITVVPEFSKIAPIALLLIVTTGAVYFRLKHLHG